MENGLIIEINNIRKRRFVRAKKLRDNSKDMQKYQGSRVYQHFEENKKQWERQKKRYGTDIYCCKWLMIWREGRRDIFAEAVKCEIGQIRRIWREFLLNPESSKYFMGVGSFENMF